MTNNTISLVERRRREKAVSFARASIGLEGFILSKETEAFLQRFVAGEIDLAEFVQVVTKPDLNNPVDDESYSR